MMRKTIAAVIGACLFAAGAAAQGQINWTPNSFEELRVTILGWANATRKPLLAASVAPESFAENIPTASVLYLDTASRCTATRSEAILFAIAEVEVTIASIDEIYFRDQTTQDGLTYRYLRTHYELNCDSRTIGARGFEYYCNPASTDALVLDVPDRIPERSRPPAGTINEIVVNAVCDGTALYTPQ